MKRYGYLLFLGLLVLPGCATWGVVKKDIAPGVKDIIIAAGPKLGEALIVDLSSLVGWPFLQVESLVAKEEEKKPTQ